MNNPPAKPAGASIPKWLWLAAGLGLAWNVFGVVQYLSTARASVDALVRGGMTQAQATLYAGLPAWMGAAFAVGVLGGVLGSALLLLRRRATVPVFVVSLMAYVVLYIGDITLGVFEAFGTPHVVILSLVVLIAGALLWLALRIQACAGLR
jgi:hypothetical protein